MLFITLIRNHKNRFENWKIRTLLLKSRISRIKKNFRKKNFVSTTQITQTFLRKSKTNENYCFICKNPMNTLRHRSDLPQRWQF